MASILVAEDNDINALLAGALLTGSVIGQRLQATEQPLSNPGWPRVRQAPLTTWFSWALVGDARTYMLALKANAQTDDREAVLCAGLDGLLIKPLDRERLREALSTTSARAFDPLAA